MGTPVNPQHPDRREGWWAAVASGDVLRHLADRVGLRRWLWNLLMKLPDVAEIQPTRAGPRPG